MLNVSNFERILTHTVIVRAGIVLALMLLLFGIVLVDSLYHRKTGSNNVPTIWHLITGTTNKAKSKLTIKEQSWMAVFAGMLLVAILAWNTITIYKDISQQQYMCVSAEYRRDTASARFSLISSEYVYITFNDEELKLKLPVGLDESEFPKGNFRGIVWYSKESKYILDFIPE